MLAFPLRASDLKVRFAQHDTNYLGKLLYYYQKKRGFTKVKPLPFEYTCLQITSQRLREPFRKPCLSNPTRCRTKTQP